VTRPVPGVTATATVHVVRHVVKTVTATVTAQPPPPKHKIPGNGTYLINSQIAPGTYKSAGPSPGSSDCYWEVDNAGNDNIVNNANTTGQAVMLVLSSAWTVTTQGCQTFYQVT